MIVYGDSSFKKSIKALIQQTQIIVAEASSLDDLRRALVQAGMLEQAIEDEVPEWALMARGMTDFVAAQFLRGEPLSNEMDPVIGRLNNRQITVKLPEGFALYALYPECYRESTLRWLSDHPAGKRVEVIGVRSIGTTLSAVVCETLRSAGVQAERRTVRPTGHPFARSVDVEAPGADWVLVVDEGPGLSGSSMASVADALVRSGFSADRIAFLCGHGNGPGSQASPEVLAWWSRVPVYHTPTEDLRWEGKSLNDVLQGDGRAIHDVSEGRWRAFAYEDPSEWPAVATRFERPARLVENSDDTRTLWTFVGLDLPDTRLGFRGEQWIEGKRLQRESFDAEMIADHIVQVAGPLMKASGTFERLSHMLYWNTKEAFGEGQTSWLWRAKGASAGDGDLSPHLWVRGKGKIRPAEPWRDHTIVGRQLVDWDIAGAIVEWEMNFAQEAEFVKRLPFEMLDLPFYRCAYAAFRMGLFTVSADACGDPEDEARQRRAATRYRERLAYELGRLGKAPV